MIFSVKEKILKLRVWIVYIPMRMPPYVKIITMPSKTENNVIK